MNGLHKQTPLYDALMAYRQGNPVSCHVPGHKNGTVFPEKAKHVYGSLLQIDATEVEGLDDLHAPEGAILEAECLLSKLYDTQKSYLLVNGSTCGNLAMILGNCQEGDVVLVQRNCHKSVLHALMLAKATPIFLRTKINLDWGTSEGITKETVSQAIRAYPEAKALILTYPSYYGVGENLKEIIALAHHHQIMVLVDEAHGAHFIGRGPFLRSSLSYGADYVVQSAHKTLPAMTMGSYLHVNHSVKNYEEIEMYLQMLQSSSPSYPIMASLDLARSYLGTLTDGDLRYTEAAIEAFKHEVQKIEGIHILCHEDEPCDLLKVTIQTDGSFTGYQLQEALQKECIYSELADPKNILLVLPILKNGQASPYDKMIAGFKKAVAILQNDAKSMPCPSIDIQEIDAVSKLELSFAEMKSRAWMTVPFAEAIDCISAETIVPYPPGIPYLIKGEKITAKKVEGLSQLAEHGARFHCRSSIEKKEIRVYI